MSRPARAPTPPLLAALSIALAPAVLIIPARARAHQIWIEQDAKGAKVYFGEYAANLREVSPGRLDKFGGLEGHLSGAKGEKPVAPSKSATGFVLPARAARGESLTVQDPGYPTLDRKDPLAPGKTRRTFWTPAARYVADFRPQTPRLTLDIVPTGKTGELQVVFRGKPLAEAKVDVTAASGWSLSGETDQAGKVSFSLPWKSGYMVKVNHTDSTPGKRRTATGEEAYDVASFATTLTFVTTAGLPAPPPPAPAKPSEMAAN